MRIAFLCWGSLYWSPGILRINGSWQRRGPLLPIEFARVSRDGRATLVLCEDDPDVAAVEVLWGEAVDTDLDQAKKNLAQRENRDLIGHEADPDFLRQVDRTVKSVRATDPEPTGKVDSDIWTWAKQNGFDAVVWTALASNWDDEQQPAQAELRRLVHRPFNCDNLKAYLRGLRDAQASSDATTRACAARALEEAERYIRLAPPEIMTRCRLALIADPEFGWAPYEPLGIGAARSSTSKSRPLETAESRPPPGRPRLSGWTEWWDRLTRAFLSGFPLGRNRRPASASEPKAEPASSEFPQLFAKTSTLLDYLNNEGYPYHIPDHLIDEIEAARDLLANPAPVSKEDRAKLVKIYRDLVELPQVSVTFEGLPTTHFWSEGSVWRTLLVWVGLAPAALATIVLALTPARDYWWVPFAYAAIFGFMLAGLYTFTGVASNRKLNQMITFCYVFTGISLAVAVLPFMLPGVFSNWSMNVPLGVLRGCAAGPTTGPLARPGELRCPERPGEGSQEAGAVAVAAEAALGEGYQWVVNIGGTPLPAAASPASPMGATPMSGSRPAPVAIQGGLVVPLYVVVLAMFGAAISMTRRVPEYQRGAMDSQNPLTNVQAREDLVFQIMQVMSAPLIAVTAYYIVKPDNQTISAVLGFGSGFASEPILLMIRNLVEKLSPAMPAEPGISTISVRVTPPAAMLKPNQPQQFSARVAGSSNSEVTWLVEPADGSAGTISQSGYYVAPAAAPAKAVTIIASSAADRTRSGCASVTITP